MNTPMCAEECNPLASGECDQDKCCGLSIPTSHFWTIDAYWATGGVFGCLPGLLEPHPFNFAACLDQVIAEALAG